MSSDARKVINALAECGMKTYNIIDVEYVVWDRVVQPFINQCKKWAKSPKDPEKVKDFHWYKPFAKMIPQRKDKPCEWGDDMDGAYFVLSDTGGADFSRADMLLLPEVSKYDEEEILAASNRITIDGWGLKYLLQVLASFDIRDITSTTHTEYIKKNVIDRETAEANVNVFADIINSWSDIDRG